MDGLVDRPHLPVLDCAPLLSGAPLDAADAARLAAALRVLADPARLRILSLVGAQPGLRAALGDAPASDRAPVGLAAGGCACG
jgi:hypothetical protein